MPNRNWKEHFLGGDFKSGSFRLGGYFGVSLRVVNAGGDSFAAAKGLSFGNVRVVDLPRVRLGGV